MNDFKVIRKFFKYSYKAYPGYYFIIFFQSIINALLTVFNIYSLSLILNTLVEKTYEETLFIGSLIVVINLFFYFANKVIERLLSVGQERVIQALDLLMANKLMKVDFATLENPYYLDLKERAKFACNNQGAIYGMLNAMRQIIQLIITLISLFTVMLTFNILIFIIICISVILTTIITYSSMRYQLRFYRDLLPINRRYGYYLNTLWNTENAKDYRMYSIKSLLVNKFKEYQKETLRYFGQAMRVSAIYTSISNLINYLQMFIIYAYVAYKTIIEKLQIGAFSLYVGSAMKFSSSVSTLIDQFIEIKRYTEYLNPFIELMDLEEVQDNGKKIPFKETIKTLEFKHVSFSYPKNTNLVLNDISFKIEQGEKISIVGLNGAGKTTLVKLICRLYHPNEGEILINGINIFDYNYEEYLQQISAVFQDFKLFAYSIGENITGDDLHQEEAIKCCEKVGLKETINKLPKGIDSLYSKQYDESGVQLSGGETQKIAIARALYKNSSLIILDEPTSALDPLAEADIYQNFNDLVKEKTAIYISHRMSSSVFCDKVLVIDGGKITDFDTHQHLMQKTESLYYKLFNSQAINYKI